MRQTKQGARCGVYRVLHVNDTGKSSRRKNGTEFALQRLCEQERTEKGCDRMKVKVDYWEIERRYRLKGDSSDKEFCINCGINPVSYKSRRQRKQGMGLLVALLIASYLKCRVEDFVDIVN